MGLDPEGFPTMGDAWAKQREKRAKSDREYFKEHGSDRVHGGETQSVEPPPTAHPPETR
jgi:hypothetical protein